MVQALPSAGAVVLRLKEDGSQLRRLSCIRPWSAYPDEASRNIYKHDP